MRKFFALALAVAMVLSLASVAFAVDNKFAAVELAGPYRYHADTNGMRDVRNIDGDDTDKEDVNRYGEGTYYLIKIKDDNAAVNVAADGTVAGSKPISSYKEVEKLKVKAEFEMGKDLVESVSIVKKLVNKVAGGADEIFDDNHLAAADDGKYFYFVEIKVAKKETTAEADIIGTLEFNRKADDDVKSTSTPGNDGIGKIDDDKHDINFTVFYGDAYTKWGGDTKYKVVDDIEHLEYDTDYALKFDDDEEVELSFGKANGGDNEGTFTVDVSGQGKVYLRYNTKADEAIAAANPGAKMFFLNFNNVKFNRTGEFVYEMDDIAAAYKVVDGQLVEIKGLELDADSATFNTRVLESYVFADAELVNPAPAAVEAPAAEVTNPTTGAAA